MLALTAVGVIGGLTLALASFLVLADRKLHVWEDPRIDIVEEMLPYANCGACGFPGCRPFAEALVTGEALPGKCTVSSEDGRLAIAEFLGVDPGAEEKSVARLACAGGSNVSRNRAHYTGLLSCQAAARVAGGGKGCFWGCLGLDDCYVACDFDAITYGRPIRCRSSTRRSARPAATVSTPARRTCSRCMPIEPPPVGGLQVPRGAGDELTRGLRGRLHGMRSLRDGCARFGLPWNSNLPVVDYAEKPRYAVCRSSAAPPGRSSGSTANRTGVVKGPAAKKDHPQGRVDATPDIER